MRLTNAMRDEFVDAILERVPAKPYLNQKQILDEISNRLKGTWPVAVREFAKNYPAQMNFTALYIEWLGYVGEGCEGRPVYISGRANVLNGFADLGAIETADLRAQFAGWLKERDGRKVLRSRIRQQVYSVNTTQELAVIFPEMTGLIPKDQPKVKKNLPVAAKGLIDELRTLGVELPT